MASHALHLCALETEDKAGKGKSGAHAQRQVGFMIFEGNTELSHAWCLGLGLGGCYHVLWQQKDEPEVAS
eukprot:1151629-Pelagomonas_calceolata.AAC.1